MKKPDYCTNANAVRCSECSLANYGRDCRNNKVAEDYGTVEHEGKTLWLTQAPYPIGPADAKEYEYIASAVDADGNDYTVRWDVLPDFDPNDTDDNACDWTKYRVYKN